MSSGGEQVARDQSRSVQGTYAVLYDASPSLNDKHGHLLKQLVSNGGYGSLDDSSSSSKLSQGLLGKGVDSSQVDAPLGAVGDEKAEPFRRIILVVVAQFMAYAILVSFQHKLKAFLGIGDADSARSHEFGFAVSFLYIGNLVFRLMHNVVFSPIMPRHRVYVAMGSMCVSMFILGVLVFTLHWKHMAWVYISYSLGGVGIGTFESNLLTSITPLGHGTKMWATLGMPLGFSLVLCGGFGATAIGAPPVSVYMFVMCSILAASLLFCYGIPVCTIKDNAQSLSGFVANLRDYDVWFRPIIWHAVALMVDMFFVALFSGVMLYLFNGSEVPLMGSTKDLVNHDLFFMIYNLFTMIGDNFGRKLSYVWKPKHPLIFLLASIIGAVICLTKFALVAPLGIFLVFFANGTVYASSTRHIDTHVPAKYNLIALSIWLCIGDFGSVAGSNMISHVRDWACTDPSQFICTIK